MSSGQVSTASSSPVGPEGTRESAESTGGVHRSSAGRRGNSTPLLPGLVLNPGEECERHGSLEQVTEEEDSFLEHCDSPYIPGLHSYSVHHVTKAEALIGQAYLRRCTPPAG